MIEIKRYKLIDAIVMYFAALLAASLLGMIINIEGKEQFNIFASYALMQLAFVSSVLVFSKAKKIDLFYNIPIRRKASLFEIISAILVSLSMFAFTLLPVLAFGSLAERVGIELNINLPSMQTIGAKLAALVIICALPAIGEELLVRGVFLKSLEDFGGTASLLLSAAIFALMHLNLMQTLHQFVVGFVLAYIVLRTQKLILAVIIHFVNNAVALFLPFIFPAISKLRLSAVNLTFLVPTMLIGAFLTISSVYALTKTSFAQSQEKVSIRTYFAILKQSLSKVTKGLFSIFQPKGAKNLKGDFTASLPRKNSSYALSNERLIIVLFLSFLAIMAAITTFA